MRRKIKSKSGFQGFCSRNVLSCIFLLMMLIIVSSCSFSVSYDISPFAYGATDKVVNDEVELRNSIEAAVGTTVIALGRDIWLSETIDIPAGKRITLTSAGDTELFKLIGAYDQDTINIENMECYNGLT